MFWSRQSSRAVSRKFPILSWLSAICSPILRCFAPGVAVRRCEKRTIGPARGRTDGGGAGGVNQQTARTPTYEETGAPCAIAPPSVSPSSSTPCLKPKGCLFVCMMTARTTGRLVILFFDSQSRPPLDAQRARSYYRTPTMDQEDQARRLWSAVGRTYAPPPPLVLSDTGAFVLCACVHQPTTVLGVVPAYIPLLEEMRSG